MTYRAKPVVRSRRAPWDRPDRKNFLTNLGFAIVVVVAVVVLAAAAILTWYDEHLSPVASVNGQSITKDDFTRRLAVEGARLQIAESRILDEFNAGRLTQEQRDSQIQFIDQRRQQVAEIVLEGLIDARIQADLVAQEGVQITDADLEARITEEATRPEQRFAWIIEIAPKLSGEETEPSTAELAEAKAKAESVLKELQDGKPWEDVAKASSTDTTASTGGQLGWVSADFDADQAFSDAVFALEKGAMTRLLVDENGIYRIGRVTDIAPSTVDPDYRALMSDRGVSAEAYDEAVRQDVVGDKLREKIESAALAEGPQRRISEIYLENQALPEALPEGAVKTRHILYSPNDDPSGAADVPADDPAWKEAEDAARKAYDILKDGPARFDELARKESDEGGADVSGGKLPWFDPSQAADGQLDPDFAAAVFKAGLAPLQVLEPVKSAFGWHVIQILYTVTDEDEAAALKTQIESGALKFEDAARDYSAGAESGEGGEIGWVGRYQLGQASEDAIFAAEIGKIAGPVVVDGDGVHLYLVHEEQIRAPEGDQKATIEASAFGNWYQAKKAGYTIERDVSFSEAG